MNEENPWQDIEFVRQYAVDATDPSRAWYEYDINFPSVVGLVPKDVKKILDFGCGPGNFTAELARTYDVEGCDNSDPMLGIARSTYPGIDFFEWDFQQQNPSNRTGYDTVIAKLVVPFVRDLRGFAVAMNKILRSEGSLIISLAHPMYTARKVPDYWLESEYRQQISKYGIYDTPVHRSLERYVEIFTEAGYVLTGMSEPQVSADQLRKHSANHDDFLLPKRLNIRLQKRI